MAASKRNLRTRNGVFKELEETYFSLTDEPYVWDMLPKDLYMARLRTLELAAKIADDSDMLAQFEALKERVDALAKPRQVPPPGGHLRKAG